MSSSSLNSDNEEESYPDKESENPNLKEFLLHFDVLSKIPKTETSSLFKTSQVTITSFDASRTHFAFGTNIGACFLYRRESAEVVKIICKGIKSDTISTVKIYNGVEVQVALGTADGVIKIVSFSLQSGSSKEQVKKYELGSVHDGAITFVHWSANGMHLFSGDDTGNVYETKIDFNKDTCNVCHVHDFKSEIVQLEYCRKILLVSTIECSALVKMDNEENVISQIGSKPLRKGRYGACFNQQPLTSCDLEIFATRPGYRLWQVSYEGKVTSTLLLKKQIEQNTNTIEMLESCPNESSCSDDLQFGKVYLFQENLLLIVGDQNLFIIDHKMKRIIAHHQHDCDVIEVSMTTDEIFILCINRKLHRISTVPEKNPNIELHQQNKSLLNKAKAERNIQNMKNTIDEMKQNIAPLGDTIHLGFLSLNRGAGQLSSKLQEKAKTFQQKLAVLKSNNNTQDVSMEDVESNDHPSEKSNVFETKEDSNIVETTDLSTLPNEEENSSPDENEKVKIAPLTNLLEVKDRFLRVELNASHTDDDGEIVHKAVRRKRSKTNSKTTVTDENKIVPEDGQKAKEDNTSHTDKEQLPHLHEPFEKTDTSSSEGEHGKLEHNSHGVLLDADIDKMVESKPIALKDIESDKLTSINYNDAHELKLSDTYMNAGSGKSSENNSSCEEMVVSVSKSTGNKILPEILLSPSPKDPEDAFQFNIAEKSISDFVEEESAKSVSEDSTSDEDLFDELMHDNKSEEDNSLMIDIYANAITSEEDSLPNNSFNEKEYKPLFSDSSSEEDDSSTSNLYQSYQNSACGFTLNLSDNWTILNTPHEAHSFGGMAGLTWFIDYWGRIFITEVNACGNNSNTIWKHLTRKARQFALSPSGDFAAFISTSNKLYITSVPHGFMQQKELVNLDWNVACSSAAFVSFAVNHVVCVTLEGNLKIQKGLSRAKPSGNTWGWNILHVPEKVSEAVMLDCNIVWVRTVTGRLLTTLNNINGITAKWREVPAPLSPHTVGIQIEHISSDGLDVVFACDNAGGFWFRSGISKECWIGEDWWQINVTRYIYDNQDAQTFLLPANSTVTNAIKKVNHSLLSKPFVYQFAVTESSIWLLTDKSRIHIVRGEATGCNWVPVQLLGVVDGNEWRHITTSSLFAAEDGQWKNVVWLSRSNSEIFCFCNETYLTAYPIALSPLLSDHESVKKISACRKALWLLTDKGNLLVRSGITSSRIQGVNWTQVDTVMQLENTHLTDIACSNQSVWAVSSSGEVYFRSGVQSHNEHGLSPAWLSIDGCPNPHAMFVKIACSPSDAQVYALDTHGNVYTRSAVSMEMPVGEKWEEMPSADGMDICVSNQSMYVLRKSGNILQRVGISMINIVGDYWKKTKTRFSNLSVTPSDELWAIDNDFQIRHLKKRTYCPTLTSIVKENLQPSSSKIPLDWELI